MNIQVEHIDQNGHTANYNYSLSLPALLKHFAVAGQRYAPSPRKLMRTLGMFLHYSEYFRWRELNNDKFSVPPTALSDPTEKSHFSTLAGRALADFLSKKIDQSLFTVNYEAAMKERGMTIGRVSRPDLLAFTRRSIFAIEAKGFSGGFGDMADHKTQSQTGGIPVNFTVACVSYNLYSNVRCKYHDPYNDNVRFDLPLFKALSKKYYSKLEEFLNQKVFEYTSVEINGELFYSIDLLYWKYRSLREEFPRIFWLPLFDYYRPRLLLPANIHEYAMNGLDQDSTFQFNSNQQERLYIDNDRVGIQFEVL